ncbi:MAG: agmatinase [Candidatus Kerfeldbacteria bacterium]|nr:agmatinase [Candidatus Kerfeldbacteria bacterium]
MTDRGAPPAAVRFPRTFFGDQASWKRAKAVVIPAPYDAAVSFRSGARYGPAALLEDSVSIEWYDLELGLNIAERVPLHTLDPLELPVSGPADAVAVIEREVARVLTAKKFPLLVGGDHSLTAGAVRAVAAKHRHLTVMHLDAHGDLRDEYQHSSFSHATCMRRAYEATGRLVQVGIRDVEEEQVAFQQRHRIPVFAAPNVPVQKIIAACGPKVYVTVDVDVFDPSIMPATGTPVPGGLGWYDVIGLLRALGKSRRIVAADIMELAPIPGLAAPNVLAARLAYKMLGYALLRR